jgi:predicted dehydrogenase
VPETISVGIVGYGFATKTFHAPLVAGTLGLRLAAVASSDPVKVHADWPDVAVDATPEQLFARADIDLVVIPTPNQTHFPLARQALAAGKHVVVDKPFTVALDDARSLRTEAEAAGANAAMVDREAAPNTTATRKPLRRSNFIDAGYPRLAKRAKRVALRRARA